MMTLATFEWFWDKPSWHWSYFWAAIALATPLIATWIYRIFASSNPRPLVDLINGLDGRWSTSKTSVLLWTGAVWFVFLAILVHTRGDGLQGAVLKSEYFVVLGIPAAAALAAKAITTNKLDEGTIVKPEHEGHADPVKGVGELFSSDTGRTDLLDSQYFGFNLILLGFFFLQFFAAPGGGLPDLPDTLLGLSGVSAAAYVGTKGLGEEAGPTIRYVVPPKAPVDATIRILGVKLATVQERTVIVMIGGVEAATPPPAIIKPAVQEVHATVPAGLPAGKTELVVIAYDGRPTAAHEFDVIEPGEPRQPAPPEAARPGTADPERGESSRSRGGSQR
jgi:hypothetical protein